MSGPVWRLRRLTPADLPAMLALQALAVAEVDPDVFAPLTEAELRGAVGAQGAVHGVFEAGELVAYQSLLAHGAGADNLAHALGLTGDAVHGVLNLEETIIHPRARGHRLNVRLTRRARAWAREHGFEQLATTVSPFHVQSLRSHLRSGFGLVTLVRRYGGSWRYVLALRLRG